MFDLEQVEGIGPKTNLLFNKLGVYTKKDLITYYPFRYEVIKRTNLEGLNDGEKIIIDGIVEGQPTVIYLSQKLTKIIFRINTGKNILNVNIYNQVYLKDEIKCGKNITIIGRFDKSRNAAVVSEIRFEKLPLNPKIEPVYYTTSGLSRKNIARFISFTIHEKDLMVEDLIPDYLQEKYQFISKKEAICQIHEPSDVLLLKKARQRLKYEELFMYLLKINYLKQHISNDKLAITRTIDQKKVVNFINKLSFKLTLDQEKVLKEIQADLSSKKRMNRLLQGDVGSGKTIIAFIATYINFLAGYQTAMMVPTEILAKQHYENAKELFKNEKIKIALLTSSTNQKEKNEIYNQLENNQIDLIIGTQSLIQNKVKYCNLGLVITDEQHRFGVNQRTSLKNKGITPDILSMSATPIPRTYALTIYGDMDVSSIKTKPEGRKEVTTIFKKEKDIVEVLQLMKDQLDQKHQIYVIAPSIENEEESEIENVKALEEKMNKAFGKLYQIGSIHGKLKPKEKEKIMNNFAKNKIQILVSTTVIEVGVNVPNSSMIVIFNANLFGLSTLHQLRGRVGRSDIQSYCLLIAKDIQERLKLLEKTSDGFEISEYDFINRGEGDLFGIRQSGEIGLVLANINKDFKMLLKAKDDVLEFLNNNSLQDEKYQIIKNNLEKIEKLD